MPGHRRRSGLRRPADGKTHLARVQVATGGRTAAATCRARAARAPTSCAAMALADALAVVPDGDGVAAGGDVDVRFLVLGP